MRRLARHLFTLCSAASLGVFLLLGVVCGAGVELGYDDVRPFSWSGSAPVERPRLAFGLNRRRLSVGRVTPPGDESAFLQPPDVAVDRLGFGYRHHPVFGEPYNLWSSTITITGTYRGVYVPTWSAILGSAILPAAWWAKVGRVRRRRARGLCPACGYDLRASPGRCPECGAGRAG